MDSAKEIARDMLDAINVDGSGFFGAVAKGFISFPVSFYYLGYDFIDTEHRSENFDDKMRIARLVKSGTVNRDLIQGVISEFIKQFISRVDIEKTIKNLKNISGTITGKIAFSQISGISLGYALTESAVAAFFSGAVVGGFIYIGAEASRAIYTSRYLRESNPELYEKLKKMGDLDLVYFLVEDIVKPFEKACTVSDQNPEEFNKICEYFFGGL
ncbi:hypothetical protein [Yersinia proxima]|uniref:hypothetical protein n=1 Tax=Yersinia proxima TaxID=2890316 RepID=UPI001D120BE9|nr:hypothetical protein [Yersinia proxima]